MGPKLLLWRTPWQDMGEWPTSGRDAVAGLREWGSSFSWGNFQRASFSFTSCLHRRHERCLLPFCSENKASKPYSPYSHCWKEDSYIYRESKMREFNYRYMLVSQKGMVRLWVLWKALLCVYWKHIIQFPINPCQIGKEKLRNLKTYVYVKTIDS